MSDRGASSGTSVKGNKYESQYQALIAVGNVKFIEKNSKGSETLMEVMAAGRVYFVIDQDKPKSIVHFDTDNKRGKQIDLTGHKGLNPHIHHGYLHNENSLNGQPTRLSAEQSRMVNRVLAQWEEYKRRQ